MKYFIGDKKQEYYKDILIRADLGLHSQLASFVKERVPEKSKILDWGAGQGALTQRLLDMGYDVTAVDIDPADFKSSRQNFTTLDFNNSAEVMNFIEANNSKYDLVMGVEVIEHVQNPWAYIDALKTMVKPGGHIVITTPHISSWLSRLEFLYRGRFVCFSDEDVQSSGHITPLLPETLILIASKLNLQNIEIHQGGTLPPIWIRGSMKSVLFNIIALALRPFQKGRLDGWCNILICTR